MSPLLEQAHTSELGSVKRGRQGTKGFGQKGGMVLRASQSKKDQRKTRETSPVKTFPLLRYLFRGNALDDILKTSISDCLQRY